MSIKIISGAQTGIDRGALDAALEYGAEAGGWCPDGRKLIMNVLRLKKEISFKNEINKSKK